jgi:biotin transport system ATP-binding protein
MSAPISDDLTPATLVMQNAGYGVPGKTILQGLDAHLDVRRLGVVGRNGSGKSTLARLVAGLIAPSVGAVTLNDVDMAQDRKAALRSVGILFQNPDHQIIFPTVIEEIAFGLMQLGQPKDEAEEEARAVLVRFGKAHWEEAHVTALSHGQKHLLCLMAVVAMRPALLVLDEPYAGLDIPTRRQLARALEAYEGSVMHISHDPDDLSGYDHVLWLEGGQIAEQGATEEVLARYRAAMEERGAGDDLSDISG